MPTFFTPEKIISSRLINTQPMVLMTDQMNVNQPNNIFPGNETIIEETNEADESQMINVRFSKRFLDIGNDDDEDEY